MAMRRKNSQCAVATGCGKFDVMAKLTKLVLKQAFDHRSCPVWSRVNLSDSWPRCDAVLDISAGDSFANIYGDRYVLVSDTA